MKFAFVVHNEHLTRRAMELLDTAGIDYYTRWDRATGKGRGTDPHLGQGGFASTNVVLMIAFQEDAPLTKLIEAITAANDGVKLPDDRIRLFQLPLERVV
jgi:hypothetical protein